MIIDNQKYRLSSLAKDLNLKNKELLELLAEAGMPAKSHSAVLEDVQFDYIMEHYTAKTTMTGLNDYMDGKTKIELKEEPKPEVKAEPKEAPKEEVKTEAKEAPKAEQKPEVKAEPKEAPKPESKPEVKAEPKVESKPEPKAESKKPEQPKNKFDRFQKPAAPQKPQPKKPEKKQERPKNDANQLIGKNAQNVSEVKTIEASDNANRAGTRVIDTRSSSVDLSKYDERLDTLVPETARELAPEKQKLKKQNNNNAGSNRRDNNNRDNKNGKFDKNKRRDNTPAKKPQLNVTLPEEIAVGELASRLKVTASEVIKRLMMLGVMASVNQTVDYDTAYLIADELGAKVTKEVVVTIEDKLFDEAEDSEEQLEERAPVVVVMGHVDHGKTSLLDAIRHTRVTAGEAGGITQHIGAYRVKINGKDITFLDTPGHAAFTAMRARGAQATDIAILVVAADDGIMPQTVEAINHAKAAGVEIIVAINKMDKHTANPDAVKQELTQYSLVPEEWGGDVICVPVSALTGMGIDDLLENVLLVAEMKELKANPNRRAKGVIIEAKLDRGRGPVATVLVQNGTLHSGDVVIAGTAVGRVRAMTDEKGKNLKAAGPSVPVEIVGLAEVPGAGDEFNAVEDERMARELAEQRKQKAKEETFKANAKVNLDDLFAQINEGVKELNIIVKADVGGSAEAVKASLEKLSNEEVKVRIIHTAVGGITEGDVMLAAASNALIIGFNVRPDKGAIDSAERQGVDIRTYRIIYECIEEVTAALKGMLAPTFKEEVLGHAEVRQTIHVPNVGTIAGSYVQDGKVSRNAQIRVVRDGIVIFEDKISSLKRFKDDAREVMQGYECGIGLERFNDIKEGDILEAFMMVEVERS
ncbi:MAG: translation initiation factor IF-2 [Clostridia bacterium]|nr:translation initiation factor IF-2 [Clostridia bacterium]